MNTIRLIGQVITSTNYATNRLFQFTPEMLRGAAENFLASGVTELEIPQDVLDPDRRFPGEGIDRETLARTVACLPKETQVISSYIGPESLGVDDAGFSKKARLTLDRLLEAFPSMTRTMVHPPHVKGMDAKAVRCVVEAWAALAEHARARRPGFQCCLHNHYDSSCETAEQVKMYLDAIRGVGHPGMRWGPDLGHCGGMGDQYLPVLEANADLIGNHIHLKTRVPAFDSLHEKARYRADRDMWGNKAEFGNGLYGGFVCCADPEIETPLKEAFAIIKAGAKPDAGVLTAAIEIDIPRQHPRLEILLSVLYLKAVHGLEPGIKLGYEELVRRALGAK